VTDAGSVISALEPLTEPMLAYLALPPAVFAPTLEALKEANLPEGSRVAVEKPFGVNLESAQELNRLLHGFLPEGPSSGSTISSPGGRSRPSWACASPMASSSRFGTATA
jgi:hypothetical protein